MLNRLFSTYTFRFMIFYVTNLSVAVFILLAGTYAFYSYDYFTDINDSLEHELDLMQAEYHFGGAKAVDKLARDRRAKNRLDSFSYLLIDENKDIIVGNLQQWPQVEEWPDGWLSFETEAESWKGSIRQYNFMARTRMLADGSQLMVARLAEDVRQNIKLVAGTMFWGMIFMILLGIVGAVITTLMTLQRVEGINNTISTIMSGNLAQRVPILDAQDDFGKLAKNLNAMLDKIESLMAGVRQVSDNIAHDLRTPLTRMHNHLTLLQRHDGSAEQQAVVDELINEAENLLATFNALLRISQVESGNRRSGFSSLDLAQVFIDAIELYEPLATEKSITLDLQINEQIKLNGDRDLLFQMLANLIDNAIKYTPEQGKVSISLSQIKDQAIIQVADSGVGVGDALKKKVFQRFFRVEASRSCQPGNGLGLSLVQAVIKLHAGTVSLEDNYPGLKVRIVLPL